jgi:hypothetical protein
MVQGWCYWVEAIRWFYGNKYEMDSRCQFQSSLYCAIRWCNYAPVPVCQCPCLSMSLSVNVPVSVYVRVRLRVHVHDRVRVYIHVHTFSFISTARCYNWKKILKIYPKVTRCARFCQFDQTRPTQLPWRCLNWFYALLKMLVFFEFKIELCW